MDKGISEREAMGTSGEGRIHYRLVGRVVQAVMTDGQHLVITTADGHEVWIRWNETTGEPEFVKQNCKVVLPTWSSLAGVGGFG